MTVGKRVRRRRQINVLKQVEKINKLFCLDYINQFYNLLNYTK